MTFRKTTRLLLYYFVSLATRKKFHSRNSISLLTNRGFFPCCQKLWFFLPLTTQATIFDWNLAHLLFNTKKKNFLMESVKKSNSQRCLLRFFYNTNLVLKFFLFLYSRNIIKGTQRTWTRNAFQRIKSSTAFHLTHGILHRVSHFLVTKRKH